MPSSRRPSAPFADYTRRLFGERAEVRFGYYASIPGLTRLLEDVAAQFARDGFRQFLVARDTTDQNASRAVH